MMFLLRCMLCLSIVYATILGVAAPPSPVRAEAEGALTQGERAGATIATSARTLWSEHPVEKLAALVAMSRLGFSRRPDSSTMAESGKLRAATDPAPPRQRR